MGKIWVPRFDPGQRVAHNGRPATVLGVGITEGTIRIRFDDDPDTEYFTAEQWLTPAPTTSFSVGEATQPAKTLTTQRVLGIYDELLGRRQP